MPRSRIASRRRRSPTQASAASTKSSLSGADDHAAIDRATRRPELLAAEIDKRPAREQRRGRSTVASRSAAAGAPFGRREPIRHAIDDAGRAATSNAPRSAGRSRCRLASASRVAATPAPRSPISSVRAPGHPSLACRLDRSVAIRASMSLVQVTVEDAIELVQRQADAMVGHPVLREIVGADAFGAVARADLAFARGRRARRRCASRSASKSRARRIFIALALFLCWILVLTDDDDAGRQVGDAHGAVGGVDALARRAAGADTRRSAGPSRRSSTSTSSASGRTATVAAEVWMRPLASVTGTRCTRWTPLSNFSRPKTPSPLTAKTISLKPPSSVSLMHRSRTASRGGSA